MNMLSLAGFFVASLFSRTVARKRASVKIGSNNTGHGTIIRVSRLAQTIPVTAQSYVCQDHLVISSRLQLSSAIGDQ